MKNEIYKTSVRKIDNEEKMAGEALYTYDISFKDMLYAKTVRATISKGKILKIEKPELPEGYYYIDDSDVKGEHYIAIIFNDWPIFATDKVMYKGEPIMLIVGPDKAKLEELVKQVKVTYEEETPEFGYVNPYIEKGFTKGDFASIEKNEGKYRVFEETFNTGYQEQVYLENQGMVIYKDEEDGRLTIKASMQCPFYIKKAVCVALGCDDDYVKVIQPAVGGAFGGKEHYPSMLGSQLATAFEKIGKPIKVSFDRGEDITYTTKRHPSETTLKAYVDENNKIIGMKADVKLNGGAYKGCSGVVIARALIAITNAYTIPNLDVKGTVYETNMVPSAAFRGFGSPQTIFAMEMFIHHIAHDLGVDPLTFRLAHLAKKGDITSTSGIFHDDIIMDELIDKAVEMSDYKNKVIKYKNDPYRGIGMSWFLHGCGFTGCGEDVIIKGKVKMTKDENDIVTLYTAAVDFGQGNHTTLKKIASMALGVPEDQVKYAETDTSTTPNSGPTAASRTIIIVGFLVEKAAKKLKKQWIPGKAQEVIETYVQPDYIKWDEDTMQGDAYPGYSWGVNVVEVKIDPISYQVDIVGCWSTYDVGHAIDERIIIGQADGGLVQALGYGYLENCEIKNGLFAQKSLSDYIVPTVLDVPRLETALIDNPFLYGAQGAKGAGELTFVGGAPAVALAVENAIGKKVNKIPVTPEYIMELMNDED